MSANHGGVCIFLKMQLTPTISSNSSPDLLSFIVNAKKVFVCLALFFILRQLAS